jgi:hypothetical protein
LTHRILKGPVTWLAQNAVQIDGVLDLSGENGTNVNASRLRIPAAGGPGGFFGGVGGTVGHPPTAGLGPGGGAAGVVSAKSAQGGTFTGNSFLVPLFGGSGGGGGEHNDPNLVEGGGGGGGGALLIASSESINITGGIAANGGATGGAQVNCPGGGSGGAIRLMAPKILGNGSISVIGSSIGCPAGSKGRIRIEAFQHVYSFAYSGGPPVTSAPFDTFATSATPSVRVVSVDGVAVSANPTGTFEVPDVEFNNPNGVDVVVEAKRVPLTATVKLLVFSDDINESDQTIDIPALTAVDPVTSRATVNVKFPTGFSRGFLRATFTATP